MDPKELQEITVVPSFQFETVTADDGSQRLTANKFAGVALITYPLQQDHPEQIAYLPICNN